MEQEQKTNSPATFSQWVDRGIYAVIGFLLIFGFTKMDTAMTRISKTEAELQLLKKDVIYLEREVVKNTDRIDEIRVDLELHLRTKDQGRK